MVDTASLERYRSPLVLGGPGAVLSVMLLFGTLPALPPDLAGVPVVETESLGFDDSEGVVLPESQPEGSRGKEWSKSNDDSLFIICFLSIKSVSSFVPVLS